MSPRAAGWELEKWPYDHAWFFIPNNAQTKTPGHVLLSDQPTGGKTGWIIDVRHFDEIARTYFREMEKKLGQPIQMPNGKMLHVAYKLLDHEADLTLQRHGQPGPTEPVTLVTVEGVEMKNTPREYWDRLIKAHIDRRTQEPAITLNMADGQQLQVSFLFFDGLCKDFERRRGDMIAAGYWPELMMQDTGQHKEGPRPVDGRPDAFGHGAPVMGPPGTEPQPGGAPAPGGAPQPQAPQGPPAPTPNLANPAAEQQELI